jgi:hypothetical protein
VLWHLVGSRPKKANVAEALKASEELAKGQRPRVLCHREGLWPRSSMLCTLLPAIAEPLSCVLRYLRPWGGRPGRGYGGVAYEIKTPLRSGSYSRDAQARFRGLTALW